MKQTHHQQHTTHKPPQSKPNKPSTSSPSSPSSSQSSPTKTNAEPEHKSSKQPQSPNRKPGPITNNAGRNKTKRALLPKYPPVGTVHVMKKRSDEQDRTDTSKHRVAGDEKLGLIKKLEMQVMILREELDKVNGRNIELVSKNICLTQQLSAALAKIDSLQSSQKVC